MEGSLSVDELGRACDCESGFENLLGLEMKRIVCTLPGGKSAGGGCSTYQQSGEHE